MDAQDGQDWIDCRKRPALWTVPPAERRTGVAGILIILCIHAEDKVGRAGRFAAARLWPTVRYRWAATSIPRYFRTGYWLEVPKSHWSGFQVA